MHWLIKDVQLLCLPPGFNLLLMLFGVSLLGWCRKLAITMLVLSIVSLWLLSTPNVANWFIIAKQKTIPKNTEAKPKAIVILGGGVVPSSKTLQSQPRLSGSSWMRLRAGVALHRQTGLPLILTGGGSKGSHNATAQLMAQSLRKDFKESAQWVEADSLNTHQNGQYTADYLKKHHIETAYIVTSAWHMTRSIRVFQSLGIEPVAYPAYYTIVTYNGRMGGWLPKAYALYVSQLALHEMLGMIWYDMIY